MLRPCLAVSAGPAVLAMHRAYCERCDYLLIGLGENRCPECGHPFDPADPGTFHTTSRRERLRDEVRRKLLPLGMAGAVVCLVPYGARVAAGFWLFLWGLHALAALGLSLPLLKLGRHRAGWRRWEAVALVLPFTLWAGLTLHDPSNKPPANLSECFNISLAIPAAVLVRLQVGGRWGQRGRPLCSAVLLMLLCGVAVGTYLLTPPLSR